MYFILYILKKFCCENIFFCLKFCFYVYFFATSIKKCFILRRVRVDICKVYKVNDCVLRYNAHYYYYYIVHDFRYNNMT